MGTAARLTPERGSAPSLQWHGPKPLRSAEFPQGVPGLSGADAKRVAASSEMDNFSLSLSLQQSAFKDQNALCAREPAQQLAVGAANLQGT